MLKDRIQIVERKGMSFCAGHKAPEDVAFFAEASGWKTLRIKRYLHPNRVLKALGTMLWLVKACFWVRGVPRGATVLAPFPGDYLAGRLGVKFLRDLKEKRGAQLVVFVHDLEELRAEELGDIAWARQLREQVFAVADELIVHNEAMAARLRSWGYRQPFHLLQVFDYKVSGPAVPAPAPLPQSLPPMVSIVGSFGNFRARYARRLAEIPGVKWQLIGPDGDGLAGWEGCYDPDEVVWRLKGNWGLVWDGNDLDGCTGTCGAYLGLNTPHKLSLYLACGLPIVIWNGAALASLVKSRGLGVAVDSLRDIPKRLAAVSSEEYLNMCKAAKALGAELRAGFFTRRVLGEIG